MALLRPRFQIDGEISDSSFTVTNTGGETDLVNVSGPGLIKELSYSFDHTGGTPPTYDLVKLEIVIDGASIFKESLEDAEIITGSGAGSGFADFNVTLTGTDDQFDVTMKDMAFITSFIAKIVNDHGSFDVDGQMDGATLWHKGA